MNDRCVGLLSNYDVEVLRTAKGRGAILCETDCGLMIFKEYIGRKNKVLLQKEILSILQDEHINAEQIIPNKEGELLTMDYDGSAYVLKTYSQGRECDMKSVTDCKKAVQFLAQLHRVEYENTRLQEVLVESPVLGEYEKHTRELKKIQKYLRNRGQKTDFEIMLLQNYDYFYKQAVAVCSNQNGIAVDAHSKRICHGDYQYHNILFEEDVPFAINFEKCMIEDATRDLGLFLRKLLEKNSWSEQLGLSFIEDYQKERKLSQQETSRLYWRLSYPEKFWKIANFYYNTGKSWIPGKNMEKLHKLLEQEEGKKTFLKRYQEVYLA